MAILELSQEPEYAIKTWEDLQGLRVGVLGGAALTQGIPEVVARQLLPESSIVTFATTEEVWPAVFLFFFFSFPPCFLSLSPSLFSISFSLSLFLLYVCVC